MNLQPNQHQPQTPVTISDVAQHGDYWPRVNAVRGLIIPGGKAGSSDWCFITSIATPHFGGVKGDVVFPAPVEVAARRIADGTHRTSTLQEIDNYRVNIAERTKGALAVEQARKQQSSFVAPDEVLKALAAALRKEKV